MRLQASTTRFLQGIRLRSPSRTPDMDGLQQIAAPGLSETPAGANKSPIRQARGNWVIEPEKSTQPSRQLLRTEEVPLGISLIGSWLACPKFLSVQRLTCLVQDGETRSTWGRVEIADLGQSIKMIARVSFRLDVASVVRWTS